LTIECANTTQAFEVIAHIAWLGGVLTCCGMPRTTLKHQLLKVPKGFFDKRSDYAKLLEAVV